LKCIQKYLDYKKIFFLLVFLLYFTSECKYYIPIRIGNEQNKILNTIKIKVCVHISNKFKLNIQKIKNIIYFLSQLII